MRDRPFDHPQSARIGNGVYAQGMSSIRIVDTLHGTWMQKQLVHVLYINKIIIDMLDNGLKMTSVDIKCVFRKDIRVVTVGVRQAKLFIV